MDNNLNVNLAGIPLKNPIILASGTVGYGEEYKELINLKEVGAIITKTITLKPKIGNPPPRIVETQSGILNSIGLENVGIDTFLKEKLPSLAPYSTPILVSIAGEKRDEYQRLTSLLNEKGVAGIEVNLSCPNIKGKMIGQSPKKTYQIIKTCREETKLPIFAKLTPQVTDITEISQAAKEGGADGLSLVNTFPGIAIDVEKKRPILGNITGGLSGPAIKPLSLYLVYKVYQSLHIPIIGSGGIRNTSNALEFILCGAKAIAIGSINFVNPIAYKEIILGLKNYLKRHKVKSVENLVGALITHKKGKR